MNYRLGGVVAMALSLGVCGLILAADGDRPPGDKPGERQAGERPAGDRPGPGARIGGGRFGFGFFPGGLGETFMTLSDLNMSPDFTLSKDQKAKIQTIREGYMKEQEKWRTDHEADLKKVQTQMAELRGNRDENREKFQEALKAQQELFATAPKGEDEAKAIKAILDPEQLRQFEEHLAKRQGERREGRPGGAPGGARTPAPDPAPRDPK